MGGHHSKQTINETTTVAANIVQNTAQDCINVSLGSNTIAINGNYNVLDNVSQRLSVSVDSSCKTLTGQASDFNAKLQDSVAQALTDHEVAATQWMDTSKDTQETNINQSVTANFTQSTVQKCVNSVTGVNNLYVSGTGNVIKDTVQDATLNTISQCILGSQQTSSVVADIANTVNQHSEYTAENPLNFISDTFKAIANSVMAVAVIVFIVVICFVFIYMSMTHGGTTPPPFAPVAYQGISRPQSTLR